MSEEDVGQKEQFVRKSLSSEENESLKEQFVRKSLSSEEDASLKEQFVRKSLSSEEDVSLKEQFVRKSLSSEENASLKEQFVRRKLTSGKAASLKSGDYPCCDLVNGAGGINDGETFRFGGGQFKIAAAQAFVKRNVDIFKPQFFIGHCLRFLEAALQTDARVDVEQKRQVGLKISGDNFIQPVHYSGVGKFTGTVKLVSDGRIVKTVGEDAFSGGKRRENDLR